MRDKFTEKTLRWSRAGGDRPAAPLAGCSNGSDGGAAAADVKAIVFLQRMPRADQGNVFDYTSFTAGGRLVKLSPPSADGKLTVLFPTADTCTTLGADVSCVNSADIQSYDLSFDAKSVVFSAVVRQRKLPALLDEPRRDEPHAADRGRERLRLSDLRPGRADPVHDATGTSRRR